MASESADYALALRLQQEESAGADLKTSSSIPFVDDKKSLVDDSWEFVDPNPDARQLFLVYNDKYFWGKLASVEVRWSPRMTLCAGLCCYEGRGGLCSIRLSQPLLKLRPRRDLVQTLLHEMIHAYLFVTQNNKDHDAHGPEFHKHMKRINQDAGTKITVYHNFHDEVNVYRQHWWRCDGKCREKPPYFGYVKRAMNRAPAPRDTWWNEHQQTCGGSYTKVKEPEGYSAKSTKKKKDKDSAGEDTSDAPLAKKTRTLNDLWKTNESKSPAAHTNESKPLVAHTSGKATGALSTDSPRFPGSGRALGGGSVLKTSGPACPRAHVPTGVLARGQTSATSTPSGELSAAPRSAVPVPAAIPPGHRHKRGDDKKLGKHPVSDRTSSQPGRPSLVEDDDDAWSLPVSVLKKKVRSDDTTSVRRPFNHSRHEDDKRLALSGSSAAKSGERPTSSPSVPPCVELVDSGEDDCRTDRRQFSSATQSSSVGVPVRIDGTSVATRTDPGAMSGFAGGLVSCPACGRMVPGATINTHLDTCLA